MGIIFAASHEDGNFSEWTITATDGGDMAVTEAAALGGSSYGIACLIDDGTALYARKTGMNTPDGYLRYRLYFDPNGLSLGNNDWIQICRMVHSDWSICSLVRLRFDNPNYTITLTQYNDAGGSTTTGEYAITDDKHYVEVCITKASSDVASDGSAELFIDKASKETLSGIDIYDQFATVNQCQIGAGYVSDASTTGTFYVDELVVRDDNIEIGPNTSPVTIAGSVGALAVAGQSGSVSPGAKAIAASVGGLAVAGQSSGVSPGAVSLTVGVGALAVAGQAAGLSLGAVAIAASAGGLIIVGQSGSILPGAKAIAANAGPLTVAGQAATVASGAIAIMTNVGALVIAGQSGSVAIIEDIIIAASVGSLMITGHSLLIVVSSEVRVMLSLTDRSPALALVARSLALTPREERPNLTLTYRDPDLALDKRDIDLSLGE